MTVKTVADKRLGKFARRQHDWFERVRKGSLNPDLVARAVQQVIDTTPKGNFVVEQVASKCRYPTKHSGPRSVMSQIALLAAKFNFEPSKANNFATRLPKLPEEAEGWFAIPSEAGMAKLASRAKSQNKKPYQSAVQVVADYMNTQGVVGNPLRGELRYSMPIPVCAPKTQRAMQRLSAEQPGDILIIPAQLGQRHLGRSARRAEECFAPNEFALDIISLLAILNTHPFRVMTDSVKCPLATCSGTRFDGYENQIAYAYRSPTGDVSISDSTMNRFGPGEALVTGFVV